MKIWTCLLAGFALGSVAIAEEDIASRMINKDTNGAWFIQPDKPKAKHIKAAVPGDYAFRIKANKGVNPWDVQASSPVAGAITEGDVIMLNYFARAEEPAEGRQLTDRAHPACRTSVQLGARDDFEDLRRMEKLLRVPRRERQHPGKEEQRVDSPRHRRAGHRSRPVLVFNFGKGYDRSQAEVLRWLNARAGAGFRRRCASLCLAFPGVEEFESHGSPNFRAREGTRKGKVFAVFALNHHGDGHVALWLNTPALEQSRLIDVRAEAHVQAAVRGPVGLDRRRAQSRVFVEARDRARAHGLREQLAAETRGAWSTRPPAVAAPTVKMKPAEIDRLQDAEGAEDARRLRKICLALPETDEGPSFGSPVWRVGQTQLRRCCTTTAKGSRRPFWVGIERQGPLEMDPRFAFRVFRANGWMALDIPGHGMSCATRRRSYGISPRDARWPRFSSTSPRFELDEAEAVTEGIAEADATRSAPVDVPVSRAPAASARGRGIDVDHEVEMHRRPVAP